MHRRYKLVLFLPLLLTCGCKSTGGSSDKPAGPLIQSTSLNQISKEMRGTNATAARLGAIGKKVHQVPGDKGYFERLHVPDYKDLKITRLGQFKVTETVKVDLSNAGVDIATLFGLSGKMGKNASQDYQVNLMDVESTLDMQRELLAIANADQDIKDYLKRPEARVITMVGTVTTYKDTSGSNGSVDLTGGKSIGEYAVKASLSAGYENVRELVISPDATVLYRMSKICWEADDRFFLKVDYFGGDPCQPSEPR